MLFRSVANAAPFTTLLAQGGGQPDHRDGLLDVNWLTPNKYNETTVLSIAELMFSSITQTHFAINSHYTNAKRVEISADQTLDYVIDAKVLESRDRTRGGIAAPPHGLTLTDVEYPAKFDLPPNPNRKLR